MRKLGWMDRECSTVDRPQSPNATATDNEAAAMEAGVWYVGSRAQADKFAICSVVKATNNTWSKTR